MAEATLYIPTYRRVDRQVTWRSISPAWAAHTLLVSPPDEAPLLRAKGYPVLETPPHVKGIGPTRQWVLDQHDPATDGRLAILLDDDLQFARRRLDTPTKFERVDTPALFDEMMGLFLTMMQQVPVGGIDNRSGANRRTPPVVMHPRIHDLMAIDVAVARSIDARLDRLEFMEDFHFLLQFLTLGYPTAALSTHCKNDMSGSNAAGGCSVYRDAPGQAAAAHALHAAYPDFATVVEKGGWNGGMDVRLDVRVAWKKAYEAGRLGRDLLGQPQEQPDFSALELL